MKTFLLLLWCVCCSVTFILSTSVSPDQSPPRQNDESDGIDAFVKSLDQKPNLLLSQTIKADKKSFFGLILIPCEYASRAYLGAVS